MVFLTFYRSFFDALMIKLFRFDVWINRYDAAVFVDTQVIQIFYLGLFTTPGDR